MRYLFVTLLLLFSPVFFVSAAITGSYDNDGKGATTYDASVGGGSGETSTAGSYEGGLIPCSGTDCNFCHVVQLGNNLINWLIAFLSIVAVISLVIAGIRMVTSGGDTGALENAKDAFRNILIGFLLVLSSWLIVDTILKAVTENKQGLDFWGKVECGGQLAPIINDNSSTSGSVGVGSSNSAGSGSLNAGGSLGVGASDASGAAGSLAVKDAGGVNSSGGVEQNKLFQTMLDDSMKSDVLSKIGQGYNFTHYVDNKAITTSQVTSFGSKQVIIYEASVTSDSQAHSLSFSSKLNNLCKVDNSSNQLSIRWSNGDVNGTAFGYVEYVCG